jgi:phosphotransferase system HPr (HPr) family protein
MQTVEIVVRNPSGLHLRPAGLFIQAAARYASRVTLENLDRGGRPVDAKSLMLILTAGVSMGHRIRITADGPDEADAVAGLRAAIASGLGEPIDGADAPA